MYPAHKLVLCICSTYFQPAMQFNNTVVYLKDVDPSHLQLLLTYMYRGEVDVSENNLTEFLKTASGLRVRGLTETQAPVPTQTAAPPPPAPAPIPEYVHKRKPVPAAPGGAKKLRNSS